MIFDNDVATVLLRAAEFMSNDNTITIESVEQYQAGSEHYQHSVVLCR